jgi:hypothetical protein
LRSFQGLDLPLHSWRSLKRPYLLRGKGRIK